MKKGFVLLLVCIMLVSSAPYAVGTEYEQTQLSQLTEEECMAFIASQGVRVPDELQEYVGLASFVKDIILAVENEPNIQFAYNYHIALEFANEIQAAVNQYYGIIDECSPAGGARAITYTLVDSETVGDWDDTFLKYNCYAYALGYAASPLANGEDFFPHPGYFSAGEVFDINASVDEWAVQTVSDLKAREYQCVYCTTDYSAIMEYAGTHTIICLRKGDHPDFHYMRLSGNSWYHKPSGTHILRYLYARPDTKDWTNERSINGVSWPPTVNKYYSGTIYYFAFRTSHGNMVETGRTGNHYHEGMFHYYEYGRMCEDCEISTYYWEAVECSGPPCEVPGLSLRQEELVS